MPGLAGSTPVPNLLVFRSANFGRVLHAFLPTVMNSGTLFDSYSRPDGPFFTERSILGSSTVAPRHRLVRQPPVGWEPGIPIRFWLAGFSMTHDSCRVYGAGFREWPDNWYGLCPRDLDPALSVTLECRILTPSTNGRKCPVEGRGELCCDHHSGIFISPALARSSLQEVESIL